MTEERRPEDEAKDFGMQPALIGVAVSGALLAAGAFALFGARTGVGVLVGGAIATANLWVIARVARAFIAQKGRAAPWAVIAGIKLIVLLGGVWMLLQTGAFSPFALIVGYGALPLGITLGSLFGPKPSEYASPPPGQSADPDLPGDGIAPPGDVVDGGPPKGTA